MSVWDIAGRMETFLACIEMKRYIAMYIDMAHKAHARLMKSTYRRHSYRQKSSRVEQGMV